MVVISFHVFLGDFLFTSDYFNIFYVTRSIDREREREREGEEREILISFFKKYVQNAR